MNKSKYMYFATCRDCIFYLTKAQSKKGLLFPKIKLFSKNKVFAPKNKIGL